MKVDPLEVCSLLSGILLSLTDTAFITRIYSFFIEFLWSPEEVDKCNSQVWIPDPRVLVNGLILRIAYFMIGKTCLAAACFVLTSFTRKNFSPFFLQPLELQNILPSMITCSYGTHGL